MDLIKIDDRSILYHEGREVGIYDLCVNDPRTRQAVVVLTNSENGELAAGPDQVFNAFAQGMIQGDVTANAAQAIVKQLIDRRTNSAIVQHEDLQWLTDVLRTTSPQFSD